MKFIDEHLWSILMYFCMGIAGFIWGARWDEDYQSRIDARNVHEAYLWGERVGYQAGTNRTKACKYLY